MNYPCSITIWRDDGGEEVVFASTENISSGGLCADINTHLAPDTEVHIRLKLRDGTIKAKAVIVRSERSADVSSQARDTFRTAFKFVEIRHEDQVLLSKAVQELKSSDNLA